MFLIRRRYLNLKKLLVVECTVAAVHVQATKHIKEEHEQKKKQYVSFGTLNTVTGQKK